MSHVWCHVHLSAVSLTFTQRNGEDTFVSLAGDDADKPAPRRRVLVFYVKNTRRARTRWIGVTRKLGIHVFDKETQSLPNETAFTVTGERVPLYLLITNRENRTMFSRRWEYAVSGRIPFQASGDGAPKPRARIIIKEGERSTLPPGAMKGATMAMREDIREAKPHKRKASSPHASAPRVDTETTMIRYLVGKGLRVVD